MKKLWQKFNNLQKGVKAGIISGVVIIFLIVLSTCSSDAEAIEPGWYSPSDGSGQGIIVRCNSSDECVVSWLTYKDSSQIWLNSNELCPLNAQECATSMSRFTGSWMGRFGEAEALDPEVNVVLTQEDTGLRVEWEALRLFPEFCDTGTGGLIFRECVGDKLFEVLAR